MLVHWIWLSTRPGLHDRDKALLLTRFSDPEDIYYGDPEAYHCVEGITGEQMNALADKDLSHAEQVLAQCEKQKIHILTYRDAAYPSKLRNISDPPLVLYYKGKLPDFDGMPVIGVVGTRKASSYGLKTAKNIGYQIGKCGGLVVSGAAFGIDGLAMSGALTAGSSVVGVLGCGVDIVYPLSNSALFADVERYGCLLSEFEPGTPPYKWNFPKRNRIISGMSDGVVVVEAPERSGALITANQAAEQGRDVFVIPGTVDNAACAGSNALLRSGAIAAFSGWDIISEYAAMYPDRIRKETGKMQLGIYPDEVAKAAAERKESYGKVAQKLSVPKKTEDGKPKLDKKTIDKEELPPYSDGNDKKPVLTEQEQSLVAMLQSGDRLVDELVAESAMSNGLVQATLTMLEVKGVIARLPGSRIALKKQNH